MAATFDKLPFRDCLWVRLHYWANRPVPNRTLLYHCLQLSVDIKEQGYRGAHKWRKMDESNKEEYQIWGTLANIFFTCDLTCMVHPFPQNLCQIGTRLASLTRHNVSWNPIQVCHNFDHMRLGICNSVSLRKISSHLSLDHCRPLSEWSNGFLFPSKGRQPIHFVLMSQWSFKVLDRKGFLIEYRQKTTFW